MSDFQCNDEREHLRCPVLVGVRRGPRSEGPAGLFFPVRAADVISRRDLTRQDSPQKASSKRLGPVLQFRPGWRGTRIRFCAPTQVDTVAATVNPSCVRATAPFLPSTSRVAL